MAHSELKSIHHASDIGSLNLSIEATGAIERFKSQLGLLGQVKFCHFPVFGSEEVGQVARCEYQAGWNFLVYLELRHNVFRFMKTCTHFVY